MNPLLIRAQGFTKTYGEGESQTHALRGVNLEIHEGEFVAVMGPSGSGKSTLMHLLGFLDRATSGSYFFRGREMSALTDDERSLVRRNEVGFIFQSFHLLSRASVLENVLLPMMYAGVPAEERKTRAATWIENVGLSHRMHHLSSQLSGGERQRVAVARAFVNHPAVVFADEPTGNLDSASGAVVMGLLQTLHEQGHTIVMVTHETEAAEYAERILTMRDGALLSDNPVVQRRRGVYKK